MTTFTRAIRENTGLIIGVMGPSGGGKTMSAMRLASGMAGGKRFAVIDTETRRALHYADMFKFDHAELHPPFRPDAYADAILDADKAGYPVIVVDSATHEWAGEGGILDWQEDELNRMAGDNWQKREACKMASWIAPKKAHKKMVNRILQAKAHVILCFRAEEKIEMIREDGKTKVIPKRTLTSRDGFIPICEKNLPFELTMSFLLTPDRPGIPHPIKLQEQHKGAVHLDKPLDEQAGKLLAQWAAGGAAKPSANNRLDTMLQNFDAIGVTEQELIDELGHNLDDVSEEEFIKLGKFYKAKARGNRASA